MKRVTPQDFCINDFKINANGFLDVYGDVYLMEMKLELLPFNFGIVTGNFNCSGNFIKSLGGAPKEVMGKFNCSDNMLRSLEGMPKFIGREVLVSKNPLLSLKGMPERVADVFDCWGCGLATLEGGPKYISGHLNCFNNPLESLLGAPEKVTGDIIVPDNLKHEIYKYINVPQSIEFIRELVK